LIEREIQQLKIVSSVVGISVPRPEEPVTTSVRGWVPIQRTLRQVIEREIQQLKIVSRVVGTRVPRPEERGQHIAPAGHKQRVEAETAFVVAGGLLLLECTSIGVVSKSRTTRSGRTPDAGRPLAAAGDGQQMSTPNVRSMIGLIVCLVMLSCLFLATGTRAGART
jgi:hypothetical protein